MLKTVPSPVATGARPRLPASHLSCRPQWGNFLLAIVILCALWPIRQVLPCSGNGHQLSYVNVVQDSLGCDDECGFHGEGRSSVDDHNNFFDCAEQKLQNVCPHSDSFCFLSTIPDFLDEVDKCSASNMSGDADFRLFPDHDAYTLSDRKVVYCSLAELGREHNSRLPDTIYDTDSDGVGLFEERLLLDTCMPISNWLAATDTAVEMKSDPQQTSLSPHVKLTPPLLDWGTKSLYTPSVMYLTVANMHNGNILHLYEPFITDPQFYLHDFKNQSIEPGDTTSIGFVFLPICVGSISVHFVLQTSFGGFIIYAKGISTGSSYKLQPVTGFDVIENGWLQKGLSLYNHFDDVLYIEEATARISLLNGNISHSAHVVCSIDVSRKNSRKPTSSVDSNHWLHLNGSRHGRSLLGLKPHQNWELLPYEEKTVLQVTLNPHMEGNISGFIYLKLQSSSLGRSETVLVPLQAGIHHKVNYQAPTDSVSVHLHPLPSHNGRALILSLSLKNGASQALRLVKVLEVTDIEKIFDIRYMEGLILFPGKLTQIALITFTSAANSYSMSPEFSIESLNCKIQILTNVSASSHIYIPCQDIVTDCYKYQLSHLDGSRDSGFTFQQQQSSNAKTVNFGMFLKNLLPFKPNLLEIMEADELILENWKSQGTTAAMSILEDHELLFPIAEVGTHCSRWIHVKNPSHMPVIMQLLLNTAVVTDECRSADGLSKHHAANTFVHTSPVKVIVGFSLGKTATIEAIVHPYASASLGPIIFHPSERCVWRSSALIRNNLSGVEWLPIIGVGGFHSLILLEDSEPVEKLEFSGGLSVSLNVTSLEPSIHMERKRITCSQVISKEFFVKNAGEISLKVLRMEVSGINCGMDGFIINTCKGFTLGPGELTRLSITYWPDFSSSVVRRDLELALTSGIIVIPMKATIPLSVINLCRGNLILSLLRTLPLVAIAAFSIGAVLFYIFPLVFPTTTEENVIKSTNSVAARKTGKASHIQQKRINTRSDKEQPKPESCIVSKYSDPHTIVQDLFQSTESNQQHVPQQKVPLQTHSSESKSIEEASRCGISETQLSKLTIKIVREKAKRRNRRAHGTVTGLATKLEASGSQSGNSTPSSPLYPSTSTPKHRAADTRATPLPRTSDKSNQEKHRGFEKSSEAMPEPVDVKCSTDIWKPFVDEWPSAPSKPNGKPVLMSSATFPGSGWRRSGAASPNHVFVTSPIAPHARAPGSRLSKEEQVKREDAASEGKEYTYVYDIWGNHLCDYIMGRSKELSPRAFSDASEGDSLSFFTRGPQSLMKMSSERLVSPDPKAHSCDVNCYHQMA